MDTERDFEEWISCIPSGIIGIISIAVSPWLTNVAILLCVTAWGVHCIHFYTTQKDKLKNFAILFFPLCFFFLIFSTFVVFCAALWHIYDFSKGIFATKSSTPTAKRRKKLVKHIELNHFHKTRSLPPKNIGRILCPFCKTHLILPEKSEGKHAQCLNCKNRFWIPDKFPHPLVQAKRSKHKLQKGDRE